MNWLFKIHFEKSKKSITTTFTIGTRFFSNSKAIHKINSSFKLRSYHKSHKTKKTEEDRDSLKAQKE
jgi:hypothetical protein